MKITFRGFVLESKTTDFKDKQGQPQLQKVLVVAPDGASTLIKIKVPMSCKIKEKTDVLFTDCEQSSYTMKDEKTGELRSGLSYKWDDTGKNQSKID